MQTSDLIHYWLRENFPEWEVGKWSGDDYNGKGGEIGCMTHQSDVFGNSIFYWAIIIEFKIHLYRIFGPPMKKEQWMEELSYTVVCSWPMEENCSMDLRHPDSLNQLKEFFDATC